MAAVKTETIGVRIEPSVKAGLTGTAEQERRSLANMIEVMIRQYCDAAGVERADANSGAQAKRAG